MLAGRETVHVLSEEHFDNRAYKQYLVRMADCSKKAGENTYEVDEELRQRLLTFA
jgi:hypothetical protein